MRYYGVTKVIIPWFDTEGMRQWSILTYNGGVDRRRILREMRKFAKRNFKKVVPKNWLCAQQIVNTYDPNKKLTEAEETSFNTALHEYLTKIHDEADAIEAGTDTAPETPNAGDSELAVSYMQN